MKSASQLGNANYKTISRLFEVQDKDQLVPDERYFFRPSEMVERKLQSVLPDSHIPISCLHQNRLIRR